MLTSYYYKETLLFLFIKFSFINSSSVVSNKFYLIVTGVAEIFSVYLKLIVFVSNQLTLIYLLYHLFLFASPGLYYKEYKVLKSIILIPVLFWALSFLFLNYMLLPTSFDFFLSFKTKNLHFEAKLSEYIEFYIFSYKICFFNCQFVVFLIFILKLTQNAISKIKSFRKLFYLVFVLISTLTTPPDIISQLLLSIFLIICYELTIINFLIKKNLTRQTINTSQK